MNEKSIKMMAKGGIEAREGFGKFYASFGKIIKRELQYRGVDPKEVDDVFQEVCLKVIKSAGSFNGGSASAWVRTIAKHAAYDKNRKFQPNFDDIETDELPARPSRVLSPTTQDCMVLSLAEFKAAYPERHYVIDLQLDGLKVNEICVMIDRSASATKEFISQSKKKLAPFIKTCLDNLDLGEVISYTSIIDSKIEYNSDHAINKKKVDNRLHEEFRSSSIFGFLTGDDLGINDASQIMEVINSFERIKTLEFPESQFSDQMELEHILSEAENAKLLS